MKTALKRALLSVAIGSIASTIIAQLPAPELDNYTYNQIKALVDARPASDKAGLTALQDLLKVAYGKNIFSANQKANIGDPTTPAAGTMLASVATDIAKIDAANTQEQTTRTAFNAAVTALATKTDFADILTDLESIFNTYTQTFLSSETASLQKVTEKLTALFNTCKSQANTFLTRFSTLLSKAAQAAYVTTYINTLPAGDVHKIDLAGYKTYVDTTLPPFRTFVKTIGDIIAGSDPYATKLTNLKNAIAGTSLTYANVQGIDYANVK